VADPAAHTHHKVDSTGSRCVACHMPATEFARMRRSDHSMRPPAPAATIAFKSPNACNGCHADKTPQWADGWVRKWRTRDYQAPIVRRGQLIEAARRRDWKRLPEMLDGVTASDRDEIFAASMIRLLRAAADPRIEPVLLAAVKDPSPLVRSSAAESLGLTPTATGVQALAAAAADDSRLVRIRAAQSLAGLPGLRLGEPQASRVKQATEEYLASLTARPDQWASHYNLGNYYLGQQDYAAAVAAYETALRFDPSEVPPWVNLSMTYARRGDSAQAAEALRRALALEPRNAEANFNMGLLQAELNDLPAAERHLRQALKSDPQMAPAAFNLCVILGEQRVSEAVAFCRRATELQPAQPRYAWTYAYFQDKQGDRRAAAETLETLLSRAPGFVDGYLSLADLRSRMGDRRAAEDVLEKALAIPSLTARDRANIESVLRAYRSGTKSQ